MRSARVAAIGVVLSGALGFPAPVFADNPGGNQYMISLSGSQSIWNPGDDLTNMCESESVGGISIDVCLDFPFTVSPKGSVEGNGSFDFSASGLGASMHGSATGALKGSTKSSHGLTRLKLALKARGSLTATGVGTCDFTGQSKLQAEIDASGDLLGTAAAKACVKCPGIGGACDKIGGIPIAANVGNGDWTLWLDVATDMDGKLAGSAAASTAIGNLDFDLKGRYKDKTDDCKLSGKADAASKGAKLRIRGLRVTGGALDAIELKYKIGGVTGEQIQ